MPCEVAVPERLLMTRTGISFFSLHLKPYMMAEYKRLASLHNAEVAS